MSSKRISLLLSTILLWTGTVARAQVTPNATTLGPSQQQQFSAGGQPASWMVVPPEAGTITSTGLYNAPAIYVSNEAYVYASIGTRSYVAQVNLSPTVGLQVSSSPSTPSSISISVSPS